MNKKAVSSQLAHEAEAVEDVDEGVQPFSLGDLYIGVDVTVLSDPHGVVRHADGAWRQRDAVLEDESFPVDGDAEDCGEDYVPLEFEEFVPHGRKEPPPPIFFDSYEDGPGERAGGSDERQFMRDLHRREERLVRRIAERRPLIADARAAKARRILNALTLKQGENEAELADVRDVLSRLDPTRETVAQASLPTTSAALRKPPKNPHQIQ